MGIITRKCYSVRCDSCSCCLEDYTGELVGNGLSRKETEELAKENGWKKESTTRWYCPECAEKMQKGQ